MPLRPEQSTALRYRPAIYQLRLQQLRRQLNVALEARVNERIRIARELHKRTEQAIAESRDAIKDLRIENSSSTDLGELLTEAGQELATSIGANSKVQHFN
jgi:hypothetical protein